MKVLHINTVDKGGAAKACIRLHKGLLKEGVDSKVLILRDSADLKNKIFQYSNDKNIVERYYFKIKKKLNEYKHNKILENRDESLELFSFPNSIYDISDYPAYREADIINLHWVTGFIDYRRFFKDNSKKIIWTLHDMNPFSGGCHYAGNCISFQQKCENCPQLLGTKNQSYARKNLKFKLDALKKVGSNLSIVTPSQWLFDESRSSRLFDEIPHYCIPNGVDGDIFRIRNKEFSRDLFSIPREKKVILFVADSITAKRKGYSILLNVLNKLKEADNIILCAVGSNAGLSASQENLFELGKITDEQLLSTVYSMADLFVIPSLEDNLPNTMLESLICGTPVIGFPIGGIKDVLIHKENGFLCEDISEHSLIMAIKECLNDLNQFNRCKISENAKRKYDLVVQAKKYIKIYD